MTDLRTTGIGLRQPHYAAVAGGLADGTLRLPFVEVHSENFFADGGAALQVLHDVRAHTEVSLHGVGLALGSAAGLDPWHLQRLARLVERIEPLRVSDHAAFARVATADAGGAIVHANDLLPIARTPASLDLMAAHVHEVQERLRRPILVENLSSYLDWNDATAWPEPDFFGALARRTGCGLLLDVNNLVVNALNAGAADAVAVACAWIDAIDPAHVGEIHLAGYSAQPDLVIDDHGSRVRPPVWRVYEHALRRCGARPTLVEWDTALPPLAVLLDDAGLADVRAAAVDRVVA
jgi:uncharacterized protein (UPF0276 family)